MNDIINAANHASAQSDRWLFIVVLLVLGAVVMWAVRWLVGKHEALMTEHRADQQAYTSQLAGITHDVNKTNQELAVVLDRNSRSLDENSNELRRCRENER